MFFQLEWGFHLRRVFERDGRNLADKSWAGIPPKLTELVKSPLPEEAVVSEAASGFDGANGILERSICFQPLRG